MAICFTAGSVDELAGAGCFIFRFKLFQFAAPHFRFSNLSSAMIPLLFSDSFIGVARFGVTPSLT